MTFLLLLPLNKSTFSFLFMIGFVNVKPFVRKSALAFQKSKDDKTMFECTQLKS